MATKGEHEKPEALDDEHQPIFKKVRLDEDAKVTEDVKRVKIYEDSAPLFESGAHVDVVTTTLSASPVTEQDTGLNKSDTDPVEVKPNITGSAYGGFSAFSGKSAFAAFTSPDNVDGFSTKATSALESDSVQVALKEPSTFDKFTPLSVNSAASSSTNGFASFQSESPVTFASFAASQPATDDGFGAMASSASATDFLDAEVAKKVEPVVPALTEAELANGEEGEQILVEKRTKLFKLVEKDYTEVGIGPLRVLDAKDTEADKVTARIVMRRESYPHGPGTKLLMNASLGSCLLCEKKTEKTMLLTVLEAIEDPEADKKFTTVTYLMRYGNPNDLDAVIVRIQAHMHLPTASDSSS
ncbi:hypothetical protein CCR75_001733 [Bremia lactucae]|uniref:RanBD1 domain-containing protein n=1 Tax=Bremia lactucae TaxID=4779 RepID=A0A976FGV9_BRELC|nr:hypothetical protein CCR75_001733 [Bremia lactucae]